MRGDDKVLALFNAINEVRADPARYARRLEKDVGPNYNQDKLPHLKQTEGFRAFQQAVRFLKEIGNDVAQLRMSSSLLSAAQAHADYLGKTGGFSHTGENKSTPLDRIADHGQVFDHTELLVGGNLDPRDALLTMIIDDGDKRRTRRDALFDNGGRRQCQWTRVGIGLANHKVYGKIYVVLLAVGSTNLDADDDVIRPANTPTPGNSKPSKKPSKPPSSGAAKPPRGPNKPIAPMRPEKDTIPGNHPPAPGDGSPRTPSSRSPPPTQRRSPRRDDETASFDIGSNSSDDSEFDIDSSSGGDRQASHCFPAPDSNNRSNWPTEKDFAVLDAINAARANPQKIIRTIKEEYLPSFKNDKAIKTAARDAIKFLKKQKPLAPLKMSLALFWAASDHAASLVNEGVVSRRGKDGSTPTRRVSRYAQLTGKAGECVIAGDFEADEIVIWLIIDSQNAKRSNRRTLFADKELSLVSSNNDGEDWACCGVGIRPHNSYSQLCVIDFAVHVQTSKETDYIDRNGYIPLSTETSYGANTDYSESDSEDEETSVSDTDDNDGDSSASESDSDSESGSDTETTDSESNSDDTTEESYGDVGSDDSSTSDDSDDSSESEESDSDSTSSEEPPAKPPKGTVPPHRRNKERHDTGNTSSQHHHHHAHMNHSNRSQGGRVTASVQGSSRHASVRTPQRHVGSTGGQGKALTRQEEDELGRKKRIKKSPCTCVLL